MAWGIGKTDVLRGKDAQSAGNEERVGTPLDQAGKPVERGVYVRVPQALDERGDQVVMVFATLVVGETSAAQGFDQQLAGHVTNAIGTRDRGLHSRLQSC
jgi:hypothetical protein